MNRQMNETPEIPAKLFLKSSTTLKLRKLQEEKYCYLHAKNMIPRKIHLNWLARASKFHWSK